MKPIISITSLSKTYENGPTALDGVSLDISRGEIIALLGPNGAGKTTLISTICGLIDATDGQVLVDGYDIHSDFRAARKLIGLVPQELTIEPFETVENSVRLSRGLFGFPPDPAHIEKILRDLSLWDKRDARIVTLSGGMKRRVLIAKALSHEPKVLFLDEPTAGVDVALRKGMWEQVRRLRDSGVTIILTTHYLEEAEDMADRIAVINKGKILLVEDKVALMKKLGHKIMMITLQNAIENLPPRLEEFGLEHQAGSHVLSYRYKAHGLQRGITRLLAALMAEGLAIKDIDTEQSSLEEIFIELVKENP